MVCPVPVQQLWPRANLSCLGLGCVNFTPAGSYNKVTPNRDTGRPLLSSLWGATAASSCARGGMALCLRQPGTQWVGQHNAPSESFAQCCKVTGEGSRLAVNLGEAAFSIVAIGQQVADGEKRKVLC